MTDATEAARRLLSGVRRYPIEDYTEDAEKVARALLAGHDEVIERCARIVNDFARTLGDDGISTTLHQSLLERLAADIRALRSKP